MANGIRPRSKKMARLYRERARFVRDTLEAHPYCQATGYILRILLEAGKDPICTGRSQHVHEPLTRARGGSIVDPDNAIAVCFNCHNFIHSNPLWAKSVGLLR